MADQRASNRKLLMRRAGETRRDKLQREREELRAAGWTRQYGEWFAPDDPRAQYTMYSQAAAYLRMHGVQPT